MQTKTRRNNRTSDELEVSEQDIANWGLNDSYYFVKYILGYNKMVERIHEPILNFVDSNDHEQLLLLPRGIFKTTTITVAYVVWRIVKNPNITILINSKNLGSAKKMLAEIKGHFKNNKTLKRLYGDFVGDIWTDSAIIVKPRTIISKTTTITVGSVDHEITGQHFDLIINDDLVGLRDKLSLAERKRTLEFYKSLIFLGQKGTKYINIGTRWHTSDLYSYLLDNIPEDDLMKRALIEDGKCIFPEEYTPDRLKALKRDKFFFATQMMNTPIVAENTFVKFNELNFDIMPKHSNTIMYVDFALSKKQTADFSSITVGFRVDNKIYILDNITERLTEIELKEKIKFLVKKWNVTVIGAESNLFQSIYIGVLKSYMREQGFIISWKEINHSTDKVFRIKSMAPVLQESVIFDKDWELRYSSLIDQLISFPDVDHDDAVDSLEALITMLMGKKKQVGVW